MVTRGRERLRRAGVVLISAGVVYCAAMAVSAKWWYGYGGRTWLADIGDGTVYIAGREQFEHVDEPLVGFAGGENFSGGGAWAWTWWRWGVDTNRYPSGPAYTIWPLGFVMIAAGLVCAVPGWRRDRRRAKGLCEKCAYSRAGLAEGAACPECGHLGD